MRGNRLVVLSIFLVALMTAIGSGQQESARLRSHEASLIGPVNPALEGISEISLLIEHNGDGPNGVSIEWQTIKDRARQRIEQEGLRVPDGELPTVLRICVNLLDVPANGKCVFHLQAALFRTVSLNGSGTLSVMAAFWQSEPVLKIAPAKEFKEQLTADIGRQVEAFIQACLAANPGPEKMSGQKRDNLIRQAKLSAALKHKGAFRYVSSKNSDVFHHPDCQWAKRIKNKNLVGYHTRKEAIAAGERPCKLCKP